MEGEPYHPLQILEDRYQVNPIVAGNDLLLISPYGHVASVNSGQQRLLGQNLRLRFDPVVSEQNVIFHVGNQKQTWLEWRKIDTLQRAYSTKKYSALWGIAAGHVGSSPIVTEQGIVCGFGDRLVCFTQEGEVVWEFAYPHIESSDERDPLQVFANDKIVHQTTSEVNISSNLYTHETYVYFVLSDYVSHTSYLAKIDITAGRVNWVSKIMGFSGGFSIVDVLPEGILLQNGVFLWIVAHNGSIIHKEVKLDVDCTACSSLVRVAENKYALLADFGVYEVKIEPWRSEIGIYAPQLNMNLRKGRDSMSSGTDRSWDFFICYANEDKEEVASPLANALLRRGFAVWYDEFSLTLGDSLRRSIDRGLAHSKYGIVIISPNFLAKEWPQRELDSLVSLEVRGEKKILPIWHNIKHGDIARAMPLLADKLAISTSRGIEAIVKEIIRSIQAKNVGISGMEKHLFLAGCCVGNRVTIAPFADDSDPRGINDFIDVLGKIGLSEARVTRRIAKSRDILTRTKPSLLKQEVFRKAAQGFFDAANELPDIVQARTSPEAFRWFRLGELLYDLLTSAYVDKRNGKKQGSESAFTLSTLAKATALDSLIEQMALPTLIKQEIAKATNAIRTGEATQSEKRFDKFYKNVGNIGESIFAWLDAKT